MSDFRDIFKIIEDEKEKWMAEHSEDKVRDMVRTTLNNTNINTILKLCGFEMRQNHWSTKDKPYWKVDHCNGRDGNSPIGHLIRDAIGGELQKIIGGLQLTKEERDAIRKAAKDEYISVYKQTAKREARQLAEKRAKEFIQNKIDSALEGEAEKVRLLMMESQ